MFLTWAEPQTEVRMCQLRDQREDSTTDHTTPASDPPTDPGGAGGGGAMDTTPPPSTVTPTGTSTGDAPRSAATARATAMQQLPCHCTLEKGNRLQMTALSGGLTGLRRKLSLHAGWNSEHQLYQLKVHLDQTASDVFQMVPETLYKAVATLRKQFKPKNIKELRGIKFYRIKHEIEVIEQFRITVQRLGR